MKSTIFTLNLTDGPSEYSGNKRLVVDVDGGSIGRSPGSAIVLPDNDKYVSSTHCLLTTYNSEYYLNDISTNGTYINGVKITKNQPQLLADGDVILIGRYSFNVHIEVHNYRTNIAADISQEESENDPLLVLDSLPHLSSREAEVELDEIFPELKPESAIDSNDPLDHFPTMENSSVFDDDVDENHQAHDQFASTVDDSDDIHAEMAMPIIPDDWSPNLENGDEQIPELEVVEVNVTESPLQSTCHLSAAETRDTYPIVTAVTAF